jgi:type II secretory pathway component GspD/PulD (secretin)
MKGQILQTPQSNGFICLLLLLAALLFEQTLPAAGPASALSPEAIKTLSELVSDENRLVIKPSSTNTILLDALLVGPTNISELEEMLHLYADSSGRTVLWLRNLSVAGSDFTSDKSLTRRETISALDAFFARKGIGMLEVGEKWVSAMSAAGCQTSADSIRQTNYIVHVQHLAHVKPSDLVALLQPFSSDVRNPILAIDSEQNLVLRDLPQNVERMLQVIQGVDVEPPPEYISEVIPFKYAKASEIIAAIHGFATNHFGKPSSPFGTRSSLASPPWLLERMAQRVRSLGGPFNLPRVKILADERTNSLLVYAGREDMKRIKELVSNLDLVAAQILVEAVIIEVNRTNGFAIQEIDDQQVPWMTNFIPIAVTNAPAASEPTRATRANVKAGFYRFAAISNDLDSFVTTLASNSSVKILQRPRIQTPNGEPAQLFIGEARPVPDEAYYSGAVTCGSSIQMVNLGVTLDVTPSVTNSGLVALDIHQTIEEANGSVTIANVGDVPITRRTEWSTKTIVNNGSVLALDGSVDRINATPRPGTFNRILTLNGLFHHSKSVTNQNELVVLLRSTILPASEAAAQLSKAEKDKMPGIKRAELEIQSEEANRLKQLEKTLKGDRDLGRN